MKLFSKQKEFKMKQYIDLVKDVLENGTPKQNRTNIPTLGIFRIHTGGMSKNA